ncbi:uncharacterized protein DMAD_04618 [Drosophila madeirensis]|uniref:Uncharacterized protein n=1 Tax=Drosophila madeirensis TaxID=30013 RepID=A0AAU9GDG0_DROMD
MAGTTILASICAGRLTKFLVHHSQGQSHLMQHKARLTGQLLDPQQKAAEGFGYLKRYAASQQPKAMKYDFTSQWTSSMAGCQRSAMEKQPNSIYSLLQSQGEKKLPVTVPAKPQPLQLSQQLEASRTTKIPYPGQKSAEMSPTLLMGIRYALGLGSADKSQPQPLAIDRFKLYRNCF